MFTLWIVFSFRLGMACFDHLSWAKNCIPELGTKCHLTRKPPATWKVVLWNNIYNINADLALLMTEAERELAQWNSYKTAQPCISNTAVLGMCKIWRSFGRAPNCCQIWVSHHHPSLSHKERLSPALNLTLFVKQNISMARRLKVFANSD